jgi:hypothetical protein
MFGDRRVVDEKLVLANESDVYIGSKGSSGYEQGSEKDEDLYKTPSREINLSYNQIDRNNQSQQFTFILIY